MSSEDERAPGEAPGREGGEGTTRSSLAPDNSAQLREATEALIKLRKLAETAEIIERGGKEHAVLDKTALLEALRDLEKPNAISRDIAFRAMVYPGKIDRLLANTENILKKIEEPKAGPRTWSQVAAQAQAQELPFRQTPGPAPIHQATKHKDREITVTIEDERQRNEVKTTGVGTLVEAIRKKEPKAATEDILAIRKLPSGDLLITTTRTASRTTLEKSAEWLRAIAASARVKRTTFSVFAHAVRKHEVNISEQSQMVTRIQEQNQRLHPGLEVLRIGWPKGTETNEKMAGSLVIEVSTATAANRMIAEGLVLNHEIRECERFVQGAKPTQCFNCQRFGHVARLCKNPTACANCAKGHSTRNCSLRAGTARRCALCKGDHGAWERKCPVQQDEKERARKIRAYAPRLYSDASREDTRSRESSSPVAMPSVEILPPRTRGRPTYIATAGRDPKQTNLQNFGKRTASNMSPPAPRERNESPSKRAREDITIESSTRDTLDYE